MKRAAVPRLALAALALFRFSGTLCAAENAATKAGPDFNRDVRPILSDKCFKCHGPDEKVRQAGLRLDRPETARRVLAGERSGESLLVQRITAADRDERMPPPRSKLELTPAEIDTLRRWVEAGASYQQHWSFVVPTRPVPPLVGQKSEVRSQRSEVGTGDYRVRTAEHGSIVNRQSTIVNPNRPRNPIDAFVLDRLVREGLAPCEEASREKIIRRLTFDLTGLPPSLDEIDEFLADDSPAAVERLVDRLLADPAYGERMTAWWLDVARYSDSYGYQVDRDRRVWPWRDWVIRAFNRNMPCDEFITWQIGGDLLPGATDEQILATTFCRLHPQKVEGGSVPEEFRVEYVADRTHTLATAFLGLTLECARCHDHKFDPVTQKEYYRLFAFFNNIDEAGLYSYFTEAVPTPTLLLADEQKKAEIAALEKQIASEEGKLEELIAARRDAFEKWLKRGRSRAIPGRVAHLDFEDYQGPNQRVPGKVGKAVRLTGDDGIDTEVGNFRRFEPFSVALWMQTPDVKERAVVFHRSRAWTDAGSRGYQLLIENGRLSASLIHFWPGNAIRVHTKKPIPVKTWLHVAVTYDGSSRADGLAIFVDGRRAPCEVVRDNLYKNVTGGGGESITIGERFRDRGFTNGLVDEFQVFNRELTAIEIAQLHDGKTLSDALSAPAAQLTKELRDRLHEYYLATADEQYKKQLAALQSLREQRSRIVDPVPEIMVMRERTERRPTYVLNRGMYNAPGEPVEPGVPAVLSQWAGAEPRQPPADDLSADVRPRIVKHREPRIENRDQDNGNQSSDISRQPGSSGREPDPTVLQSSNPRSPNRLDLARWLTDPRHPLVGRVAVNHLWQMCFGHGLVRTPEDFGHQGDPPTHPELLDWLAREFVSSTPADDLSFDASITNQQSSINNPAAWNVKRLLRLIVTSAAYRQSSRVTPDLLKRDPDNRLLARGPRHRLPAEMIRDNALAAAGLLVRRVGGPPTKPYEVAVSFKPTEHDKDAGLYRRSVYTYWKRTAPAPVMMSLDACKRDVSTVKRERTSSPLQALVLLNDPQIVEAGRVLGERMVNEHGDDVEAIIEETFRTLTSRCPGDAERNVLRRMFDEQLEYFREEASRWERFLSTGEASRRHDLPAPRVAAAGALALGLMNFDECLMKR